MTDHTPMTDDDRKAHQFSDNVLANPGDFGPDSVATARAVKAHVPAPPKSLAAEMRWWERNAEEQGQTVDAEEFRKLADRAEAIEKERDKAQQDAVDAWEHAAQTDRDHVRAMGLWEQDYTRVANERDEARAEVERLAAERLDRNPETKARVEAALNNLDQVEKVTVQKGAESNAESLDPADVKPGEAWLVECRGERRNAVKDHDDAVPWCTFNADGWFLEEDSSDVTLITRLVPAPRVITNTDELDALAEETVIRDGWGLVSEKQDNGGWMDTNATLYDGARVASRTPVTVLWEPEEEE